MYIITPSFANYRPHTQVSYEPMKLPYWGNTFAVLWQMFRGKHKLLITFGRRFTDSTRQFSCLFTFQKMAVSLSPSCQYSPSQHNFIYLCHFSRDPLSVFSTVTTGCSLSFDSLCICLHPQFLVHYHTLMASSHDVRSCAAPFPL